MSPLRLNLFSLPLLFAIASPVSAQDALDSRALAAVSPLGFEQAVYKGLVGNMLDAIPMDPSQRVGLQRTNAVVSNTFLGRSLTVLAGLSNPVLLLGGFVWGVWAAANIKQPEAGLKLAAEPGRFGAATAAHERLLVLLAPGSAAEGAPAADAPAPVPASWISPVDSVAAALPPLRVVKIWLPQRSPALAR